MPLTITLSPLRQASIDRSAPQVMGRLQQMGDTQTGGSITGSLRSFLQMSLKGSNANAFNFQPLVYATAATAAEVARLQV